LFAEAGAARSSQADRASPHLELLLAHGRSAAAGEPVDPGNALIVLYTAMRLADTLGVPT
jgi:hypothetical protein